MTDLTDQQIFDKVVNHLRTQGYAGSCSYRTPDGKKCAIGCLIDDEHYSPKFEGYTAEWEPISSALRASGIPTDSKKTCDLLLNLQQIHDLAFPAYWEDDFRSAASRWDLQVPPKE